MPRLGCGGTVRALGVNWARWTCGKRRRRSATPGCGVCSLLPLRTLLVVLLVFVVIIVLMVTVVSVAWPILLGLLVAWLFLKAFR